MSCNTSNCILYAGLQLGYTPQVNNSGENLGALPRNLLLTVRCLLTKQRRLALGADKEKRLRLERGQRKGMKREGEHRKGAEEGGEGRDCWLNGLEGGK